MALSAGEALLSIKPDIGAAFAQSLTRSLSGPIEAEGKRISSALSKSFTLGKVAAIGAFGAIADAAFKGLGAAVSSTEEFGHSVLALHRIIGGSVEDASKLEVVFEHFGISSTAGARAVSLLEKNLVNGGKAVAQYGLSLKDANGETLTGTQILAEAADKYVSLGSAAAKTAFLLNVFGRSGRDMAVIMQGGSKAIEEAAAAADKYGLVLSGSNLEAIHRYELAQNDLGLASTGLKLSIGEALIPVLTTLDHILTAGVEVFNKIPGPIKTAGIAAVGLGAALVALGLVVGVVRTAFGNLGISLGASTAKTVVATTATEALTVAEGEAAIAAGGMGLATIGVLGPLALLGGAIIGVAVGVHTKFQPAMDDAQQAIRDHGVASTEGAAASVALAQGFGRAGAGAVALAGYVHGSTEAVKESTDVVDAAAPVFSSFGTITTNVFEHQVFEAKNASEAFDEWQRRGRLDMTKAGQFLGMSKAAFTAWRISTRDNLNGVEGAMGDLADKAHLTAGQILKAFDKQIAVQENYKRNWERLLARGLPQDLAQQIQEMGLDGARFVAALANANERQFNKIIADWNRSKKNARDTAAGIRVLQTAAEKAAGDYFLRFFGEYHLPGGGGIIRKEKGGVFPEFAQGRVFMGPGSVGPFVAGEGSYSTPFGAGSEVVTPRGIEPLSTDHLRTIAEYQAPIVARIIADAMARNGGSQRRGDMPVTIVESSSPQRTLAELRYERAIRGW